MIMQLVRAGTLSALCIAAGSWSASKAQAQWGGPTCQSVAAAELAQVGQQLSQVFAQARQNMDQDTPIAIALVSLGFAGQFDWSKPITITPRVVGATAISRENLQTRCRVRATIAASYSRPRAQVDRTGAQPIIRREAILEQFETPLVYDMIFADSEILESDVLQEVIKVMVAHANSRIHSEAHLHAEIEEVRRQQAIAERRQEAQSRERSARAEAQQRALLALPPSQRPRATEQEVDIVRRWIDRCWAVPTALRNYPGSARIRIRFNIDGTVESRPEIVNPQPGSEFQQLANSAVRAIMQCSAEGGVRLPRDRYASWAEFVIAFDAQR
jgi:hypothetical protein